MQFCDWTPPSLAPLQRTAPLFVRPALLASTSLHRFPLPSPFALSGAAGGALLGQGKAYNADADVAMADGEKKKEKKKKKKDKEAAEEPAAAAADEADGADKKKKKKKRAAEEEAAADGAAEGEKKKKKKKKDKGEA